MAVVEVHREPIDGPWIEGFVLDRHVISSRPIGYAGEHMQFETTRSALGELVYQLKYRNGTLNDIVDTAVAFVNERWNGVIDCVVPLPPSLHQTQQPAVLIAAGITAALQYVSVAIRYLKSALSHRRTPLATFWPAAPCCRTSSCSSLTIRSTL